MTDLSNYYQMAEEAIRILGVDPTDCQDQEPGRWFLIRGSAEIVVQIYFNSENNLAYCRVYSPFMRIPDQNQLTFFGELLDINMDYAGIAFGRRNDWIFLKAEREVNGLDVDELVVMIKRIGIVTDHYDDIFKAKYETAE